MGVIARFDAGSGERLAAREVASAARAITHNPSQGSLLVACQAEPSSSDGVLLALDGTSLQTQSTASTAPFPIDVLWGETGGFVVGAQDLDQADLRLWWHSATEKNGVLLEVTLTGAPEISQDQGEVFAPTHDGIAVLSTKTGSMLRSRELAHCTNVAVSGAVLAVSVENPEEDELGGTVLALNPGSLETQASFAVTDHGIDAVCIDPRGRYLVASQTTDQICATIFDLTSANQRALPGNDPAWADVILTVASDSGDQLLVATGDWGEAGVLAAYDPTTGLSTGRFELPGPPEDLVFASGAGVLISSLDSDRIHPITLSKPAAQPAPEDSVWRAGFGAALVLSKDGSELLTAGSLET